MLYYYIFSVCTYHSIVLFSGFPQIEGNFADGQNNSKYPDVAVKHDDAKDRKRKCCL